MSSTYWKNKCFDLAKKNDLEIHFSKISSCSPAYCGAVTTNPERFFIGANDIHYTLHGVDGYYNNLDWKSAYKYLNEEIEEGFFVLDDLQDEPEEFERLCYDHGLRHYSAEAQH